MKSEDLFEAIGEIDDIKIKEAGKFMNKKKNYVPVWIAAGAAACLCAAVIGAKFIGNGNNNDIKVVDDIKTPNPQYAQVGNPLMEVDSLQEMEKYLDFDIIALDKEAIGYTVIVNGGFPEIGRIHYADGSLFSVKYGTGDISGIYGGTPEKQEDTNGIAVSYMRYEDTRYALWECGGFTYALTEGTDLEADVEALTYEAAHTLR